MAHEKNFHRNISGQIRFHPQINLKHGSTKKNEKQEAEKWQNLIMK